MNGSGDAARTAELVINVQMNKAIQRFLCIVENLRSDRSTLQPCFHGGQKGAQKGEYEAVIGVISPY
jgi:hypothetical protein